MLTVVLFAFLATAAAAVFFLLPGWVRTKQELAAASPAGDPPAPATAPVPDPDSPEGAAPRDDDGDGIEPQVSLDPPAKKKTADVAEPTSPRARAPAPRAPEPAAPAGRQGDGDAFARAMSEGLAALDRGDHSAARDAFARAQSLRPASPQSADGLARAEAALRLAAITELRREARDFEAEEDWQAAAARYEEVLKLDPNVEFAQTGQRISRSRAELSSALDFHVAHPERLSSDEVLKEVSAILAQASEIDPAGPVLRRQVAALAALVEAYSTPVGVVLESDGLTEVTVYKVGRQGTFSRRELELRPGTYTVVGSRRGYRDVRRQLVIVPGVAPEPVSIRCQEAI